MRHIDSGLYANDKGHNFSDLRSISGQSHSSLTVLILDLESGRRQQYSDTVGALCNL